MTRHAPVQDPRSVAGVVVWLILATSMTLEQGQDTAAQWGIAATLAVLGIAILLVLGRAALTPLRSLAHRIRRHATWRTR
jgi:hypothetical protein